MKGDSPRPLLIAVLPSDYPKRSVSQQRIDRAATRRTLTSAVDRAMRLMPPLVSVATKLPPGWPSLAPSSWRPSASRIKADSIVNCFACFGGLLRNASVTGFAAGL
jgi:hypothetical protein